MQYIKWLQAIGKLEEALHYIFSPLRLTDMRKLLEACYYRCLAVREALVSKHKAECLLCRHAVDTTYNLARNLKLQTAISGSI